MWSLPSPRRFYSHPVRKTGPKTQQKWFHLTKSLLYKEILSLKYAVHWTWNANNLKNYRIQKDAEEELKKVFNFKINTDRCVLIGSASVHQRPLSLCFLPYLFLRCHPSCLSYFVCISGFGVHSGTGLALSPHREKAKTGNLFGVYPIIAQQ